MAFISCDITKNHVYFLFLFISYFLREYIKKFVDKSLEGKNYAFGKSKNATITLFNIYVYLTSNLLAIFCVCISLKNVFIHISLNYVFTSII